MNRFEENFNESEQKFIKNTKRKVIHCINSVFNNGAGDSDIMSSIHSFLLSCGVNEYRKCKIDLHYLFYPVLVDVDFGNLYEISTKHIVTGMPRTLKEYVTTKEWDSYFGVTDTGVDLDNYIEDYSNLIIGLWNNCKELSKIGEEDCKFISALIIGEYVTKLQEIDSGKVDVRVGTRDRFKYVLNDNKELEKKIADLTNENNRLKNDIYLLERNNTKKVSDESKRKDVELNRVIQKQDEQIKSLKDRIREFENISIEIKNKDNLSNGDIDYNKKVIFVGGCDKSIELLKKLFGNSKFYTSDKTKIESAIFERCDCIVYLTNFLSHSLYYKVKNLAGNVTQIHCNYDNISKILDQLSLCRELIYNEQ